MNYKKFFDLVRNDIFNGRLSAGQVEGINKIIAYRDVKWPKLIDEELAYLLATVKWETGHTMQPVEEGHPLTGERLRAYQRKLPYYPAYGRGLVQTTHAQNYARLGLNSPEDYHKALEWDYALRFLFEGCIYGWFRGGRKLSDYISKTRQDYYNARDIVNGKHDKADIIAGYANKFLNALRASGEAKPKIPEVLEPATTGKVSTTIGIGSIIVAVLQYLDGRFSIPEIDNWVWFVVVGVVLIFFVGRINTPSTTEIIPVDSAQEVDMNIGNAIKLMQTLVPILEKIVEELPRMKAEIAELRSMVGDAKSNSEIESEDSSILDRISNISERLNKIMERDNG